MTRVFVCVLDGVRRRRAPDAGAYGDRGSDTLRPRARAQRRARCPISRRSGSGEVVGLPLGAPRSRGDLRPPARARRRQGHDHRPLGDDGRRRSNGRSRPIPDGFPAEVIEPFTAAIGRGVLGNRPASGTAIIDELGDEHVRHRPAHRLHVGRLGLPDRLPRGRRAGRASSTRWCEIAREHPAAGRTRSGASSRGRSPARSGTTSARRGGATSRCRRPGPTYLDLLHERGVPVVGVGKIGEIFAQRGVDVDDHTTDNTAGIAACRRHLREMEGGLLFANLVDFDQVWGHRNDVAGLRRRPARRSTRPCPAWLARCCARRRR